MVAVLLAGCGSDGPTYDPPPPEAVASCSLVQKEGSTTFHNALWFDAASRLVQIDGFGSISTRLEYDDQNRVVRTSSTSAWTTYAYEPARITSVDSYGTTYLYDLDASGQIVHIEGPEEKPDSDRYTADATYDSAGHVTSYVDTRASHHITYDAQGRVSSSVSDFGSGQISAWNYAYTEAPGHLAIDVTDPGGGAFPWTYDFDDAGRVVHAEVDGGGGFTRGYAYSYVDDAIAAIPDGSSEAQVTATGMCPAVASTLTVDRPLTFNPLDENAGHSTIWIPNPPVDAFAGYGM